MSALPRHPENDGLHGLRMSAGEFTSLGETPELYELVDGVVTISPRPTFLHQQFILALWRQLDPYVLKVGGALAPEVELRLSPMIVYHPDLAVFRPGRIRGATPTLDVAPDLIVEVLTPSTKAFDLTTKRDDYEKFGVGEYWLIDPKDGRVRCYRCQGVLLIEAPVVGDSLESAALPGFVLDLKPIRALAETV